MPVLSYKITFEFVFSYYEITKIISQKKKWCKVFLYTKYLKFVRSNISFFQTTGRVVLLIISFFSDFFFLLQPVDRKWFIMTYNKLICPCIDEMGVVHNILQH